MEEDIKQAKATISSHDNVLHSAMERAIKATKSVDKNAKAAKVGTPGCGYLRPFLLLKVLFFANTTMFRFI